MAKINTTINIHVDGQLYALNKFIKEVSPVASQPSALDEIAKPVGNGFKTGDIFKKIKRSQVASKAAAALGGVGGFKGASSQALHTATVTKNFREDNIVYNEGDLDKLKEGKGQDILALEVADFIITGRELDLQELIAEAKVAALAVKLHTAFDPATGLPTGNQPADGDGTFDAEIAAIRGGRRVVEVTDFDEEIDTRLNLLREAINYFVTIGSPKAPTETGYLYSINGHLSTSVKILASYLDIVKVKEKDTQKYITVTGNVQANMSGIVGYVDNNIKIIQTNQIPAATRYAVMTDRVFVRDLDPSAQYIGKVRDTGSIVMEDGKTYNLKPNEKLLQFYQGRTSAIRYPEEIIFIDQK